MDDARWPGQVAIGAHRAESVNRDRVLDADSGELRSHRGRATLANATREGVVESVPAEFMGDFSSFRVSRGGPQQENRTNPSSPGSC